MDQKTLTNAATKLLRQAGYTWSGRDRREVDPKQCGFEYRMVRVPTRGKSRRHA